MQFNRRQLIGLLGLLATFALSTSASAATVTITTPAFPGDGVLKSGGKVIVGGQYTAASIATLTVSVYEYDSATNTIGALKGSKSGTIPASSTPRGWTATFTGLNIGDEYWVDVTVTDALGSATASSWFEVVP